MAAYPTPDFEVSETVEQAIEELLDALQDRVSERMSYHTFTDSRQS